MNIFFRTKISQSQKHMMKCHKNYKLNVSKITNRLQQKLKIRLVVRVK